MALGGVPVGNRKAIEPQIPALKITKRGLIPILFANITNIGTKVEANAVFGINSVTKVLIKLIIKMIKIKFVGNFGSRSTMY